MKKCEIHQLYNLEETIAADIFKGVTYPWEVLPEIGDFILKTAGLGRAHQFVFLFFVIFQYRHRYHLCSLLF